MNLARHLLVSVFWQNKTTKNKTMWQEQYMKLNMVSNRTMWQEQDMKLNVISNRTVWQEQYMKLNVVSNKTMGLKLFECG